jgi:hypothetical protein
MTPRALARPAATESAWFTLAWYAVLLAVVFTTAFWIGRVAGPEGPPGIAPGDDAPGHAPHAAAGG